MKEIGMKIIARIKSDFSDKFGLPRQSGLVSELKSYVIFEPEYRNADALKGIEDFSHLWLLWYFDRSDREDWSATVRPPKLGGNKRVGVFATRSPFRPNPIGLSSVRLDEVIDTKEGKVLVVSGADIADGTPVFDVKPYLAYTDSHENARGGFTEGLNNLKLNVYIDEKLSQKFPSQKLNALISVLEQDPRPGYHDDPERVYGFSFAGYEIKFKVKNKEVEVISIEKGNL
ncbi:MAG: tRNA (N6-threonylcarbamoyladenosine(37)-N6)-methyltransferase TrmO [Clostridia bacterium]|nr:tRNA (N6-threonylcarbamoyladenosine(37)-N6)-methyltransferase TrmO [Clostridia bacterium]